MRRPLVLLALLLVAIPLRAQSPGSATPSVATPKLEVPYRLFTLPNGLTVILHQDRSVPVVAVNVWYHVGSANERRGRTGFAHLFEHLMFEGSKNVKEGEFDTLLEAAGGNNNGSTNNDRTNYIIDVPVQRAGAGALSRVGSHGLSARYDVPRARRRSARCGQERTSSELRESPYGMAFIALDSRCCGRTQSSVLLADDWVDGGSHRRQL